MAVLNNGVDSHTRGNRMSYVEEMAKARDYRRSCVVNNTMNMNNDPDIDFEIDIDFEGGNDVDNDNDNDRDHESNDGHVSHKNHSNVPFYSKPIQRERWGRPDMILHVGWNTLFFDLFYVAAAYNLGNLLISFVNQTEYDFEMMEFRGWVYYCGIFGGIYNIFVRMMYYESQFHVNSYFHRLMEMIRTINLAMVVAHIKNIMLLMDPLATEAMGVAGGLFGESVVSTILCLELYYRAKGDIQSIRNQVRIQLTYYLPMMGLYFASFVITVYHHYHDAYRNAFELGQQQNEHDHDQDHDNDNGHGNESDHGDGHFRRMLMSEDHNMSDETTEDSFGIDGDSAVNIATDYDGAGKYFDYNSWNKADIPMALLCIALLYSVLWDSFTAFTVWSDSNRNIRSYMVPMNISYQIHRFGEFTMLFFGEGVMSLLIISPTVAFSEESIISRQIGYSMLFLFGVLNVMLLQVLKYETEPHNADDHCLWRGHRYLFVYTWLTGFLCVVLVAFAISFKLGLKLVIQFYDEMYGDGHGDSHRILSGAEHINLQKKYMLSMYVRTLGSILIIINFMETLHHGLKNYWCNCTLVKIIHWVITVLLCTLIFFIEDFGIWIETAAAIGFLITSVFNALVYLERHYKNKAKKASNEDRIACFNDQSHAAIVIQNKLEDVEDSDDDDAVVVNKFETADSSDDDDV